MYRPYINNQTDLYRHFYLLSNKKITRTMYDSCFSYTTAIKE